MIHFLFYDRLVYTSSEIMRPWGPDDVLSMGTWG